MLFDLLRPAIFSLDAERAHRLAINALKLRARLPHLSQRAAMATPNSSIRVAGLDFPNPVGVAAGFDKNGEVPAALLGAGFGFVETGSITPRPQEGNPRPRLFRLVEDEAVINRLGFNNDGLEAALVRLGKFAQRRQNRKGGGLLGVNVGANKDSADRVADYLAGIAAFAPVADYIAVNISSPNTPGLRNLQDAGELDALLGAIAASRGPHDPPIFLKVAPDLEDGDEERIVRAALDHSIDALIVSNTTISRPALHSPFAHETGGLSGAPLRPLALSRLRRFRAASEGAIPLIGVGGISSGADAWARIRAGASLVQLYSALVYRGPGLGRRIVRDLERAMIAEGFASLAEAVGSE